MTLIALLFALCAIVLYVTGNHYRCRAANLTKLLDFERNKFTEQAAELDDAERQRDHYQRLHASLLEENTTLSVDLAYTEERNRWLESLHAQRKGTIAGWYLLNGWARVEKKADARMMETLP